MSEYQFYEFQTLDRRLTAEEMAELRDCSSRARITPTSFVNDYAWGSFRGDEDAWMERYFDGFARVANWGSRAFSVRLAEGLLALETAASYAPGDSASVRQVSEQVILTLRLDPEDGGYGDWIEGDGWLDLLLPIRAELAGGDLRALYLGWLLCVQAYELDDDDEEPPVPNGLASLSEAQAHLLEFFHLDPALVRAAAEASAPLQQREINAPEIRSWIETLTPTERDDLLADFIAGEDHALSAQVLRRVRERVDGSDAVAGRADQRRTVGELLAVAEGTGQEIRRAEAEAAARETARREREAGAARARHLDGLAGSESKLWRKVDELVATSQPRHYDQAAAVLQDLRDLAARGGSNDFQTRLDALREKHARKRTFIVVLDRAGLQGQ